MNKQKKSYTQPTLEVTETYIKNDILSAVEELEVKYGIKSL